MPVRAVDHMKASTEIFSDRVDNYVKYRPSYPAEVLDSLRAHCGLGARSAVADIGSGTGIFTELLLRSGCQVFAVEPNDEMRHAAEQHLCPDPRFHSLSSVAEHTGLDSGSIDIVTAAQAFHWFRTEDTRKEFQRILKATGWIALVWNQRNTRSPFQRAYDELLRVRVPEYDKVNYRKVEVTDIAVFLDPTDYRRLTFKNCQHFDMDGLKGRKQSSSYIPPPGTPLFAALMVGLEAVFEKHAMEGRVVFEYETQLHLGRPWGGEPGAAANADELRH